MHESLAAHQFADYPRVHARRLNLVIHIVAVPLFVLGNIAMVAGAVLLVWWIALIGLALSAVAFAAQGIGHGKEPEAPEPFTGPRQAIARIFTEQWFTFWRFVMSGGWWRAFRAAS